MKISKWSALLVGIVALSACSDDPFAVTWVGNPTESLLFALDVEELGAPNGYRMLDKIRVVLSDPSLEGAWDFAVGREGGEMVLFPPGALGVTSRAAISPAFGMSFDEVNRAPVDTLVYVSDEPVTLSIGSTYIIRTREQAGTFGRTCIYYGKLEPLAIDLEVGTVRFMHDTNPDCNNRSLVPTDG